MVISIKVMARQRQCEPKRRYKSRRANEHCNIFNVLGISRLTSDTEEGVVSSKIKKEKRCQRM